MVAWKPWAKVKVYSLLSRIMDVSLYKTKCKFQRKILWQRSMCTDWWTKKVFIQVFKVTVKLQGLTHFIYTGGLWCRFVPYPYYISSSPEILHPNLPCPLTPTYKAPLFDYSHFAKTHSTGWGTCENAHSFNAHVSFIKHSQWPGLIQPVTMVNE